MVQQQTEARSRLLLLHPLTTQQRSQQLHCMLLQIKLCHHSHSSRREQQLHVRLAAAWPHHLQQQQQGLACPLVMRLCTCQLVVPALAAT